MLTELQGECIKFYCFYVNEAVGNYGPLQFRNAKTLQINVFI